MPAHSIRVEDRGDLDRTMGFTGFQIPNLFDRVWLILHAVIGGVDISERGMRVERRRIPIGAAADVRPSFDLFRGGNRLFRGLRPFGAAGFLSIEVAHVTLT